MRRVRVRPDGKVSVPAMLVQAGLCDSQGAAAKLIIQGVVKLNRCMVNSAFTAVSCGVYVVQVGPAVAAKVYVTEELRPGVG